MASQNGHKKIIEMLIEAKADVNFHPKVFYVYKFSRGIILNIIYNRMEHQHL